jgi:hypothetical protein
MQTAVQRVTIVAASLAVAVGALGQERPFPTGNCNPSRARFTAARGVLIPLSDGGAAIHIGDGFTSRTLVLVFANLRDVSGIDEGAQFRFRCTVESFDYLYVHMEECSIVC